MNFFQKVHAGEAAEPSSPPAGGEIASAFSFCQAFFFCASGVKRKSGGNKFARIKRLRLCNKKAFLREEGGPLAVEGARATQGLDKFYCNALSIFSARLVAAKRGKTHLWAATCRSDISGACGGNLVPYPPTRSKYKKGKTPLVVFPSFLLRRKFTLFGRLLKC